MLDSVFQLFKSEIEQKFGLYSTKSNMVQRSTDIADALFTLAKMIPHEVLPNLVAGNKYLFSDGTTISWENLPVTLPDQATHSGKYLKTDGTTASWEAIAAEIPSQTGHNGKYLVTDGSAVSWAELALKTVDGNSLFGVGNIAFPSLAGYVPYSGANSNLHLGANNFSVATDAFYVTSSTKKVSFGTTIQNYQYTLYATGNDNRLHFLNNTTGTLSTDGTYIGLDDGINFSIWQRETGYIRFGTNETERMRIVSNGVITFGGVTSSNPAFKPQSSSNPSIQVRNGTDSGYARFTAGAVSINNTMFNYTLNVYDTGNACRIALYNDITGTNLTDGTYFGLDDGINFSFWQRENGYIRFGTNEVERVRITPTGMMTFGGISAAYAGFKPNGPEIQTKLADDSGNADFLTRKLSVNITSAHGTATFNGAVGGTLTYGYAAYIGSYYIAGWAAGGHIGLISGGSSRILLANDTAYYGLTVYGNKIGINTDTPTAMFHAIARTATDVVQINKAAAAQTANLDEWKNSSNTILSSVSKDGWFAIAHANAPTAFVDLGASITSAASLRFRAGVAPTGGALLDGCVWYKDSFIEYYNNTSTKKLAYNLEINSQNTSYTLVLADQYKLIKMTSASANNLTVPLNATVAFPINTEILITQYGAGTVSVVATGGVTIRSNSGGYNVNGQYNMVSLIKIDTDEWLLIGGI